MVLNELSFMDIVNAATAIGNAISGTSDKIDRAKTQGKNYSYSSVNRAASGLIAVFPILASSNVKLETGTMCAKYIERKQCLYLQLVLAASNIDNAESGFDYLRNFHQNVTGTSTLADYERMIQNYFAQMEGAKLVFDVPDSVVNEMVNYMKHSFTQYYAENYSRYSLADYQATPSVNGYTVSISPYSEKAAQILEARQDTGGMRNTYGRNPSLTDTDVKKANEAIPSLLIVHFVNKDTKINTEFLIGVKAKLIPTDYTEILNKIVTQNKDNHKMANLIRATSGEINFIRDYLLGLDAAKDSIRKAGQRGSRESLWKNLEARATKAKLALSQNKVNMATAVTTVLITAEDADMLYKEENLDIRNVRNARKFLEAYNLCRLAICNDIEESIMIIEDNDDPTFETYAYTMLERETSDGAYKKILNLMAKR